MKFLHSTSNNYALNIMTRNYFMVYWPCILVQSLYVNQPDAQIFHVRLFLFSTFFGNHVPIIRTINCTNAIPGIFHSVWTTVWYAGWDETAVSSQPAYQFLNVSEVMTKEWIKFSPKITHLLEDKDISSKIKFCRKKGLEEIWKRQAETFYAKKNRKITVKLFRS